MPKQPATSVLRWLEGQSIADLEAVRIGRHLLFPDVMVFHETDGSPREDRILIRVPTPDDKIAARIDAILYVRGKVPSALKTSLKVETVEDARRFIGAERFEEIDTFAIAARCMHDPKPPPGLDRAPPPWKLLGLLIEDHQTSAIMHVYEHMDLLSKMLDVRLDELTEEQMWGAARYIAERENASPLGAMSAGMQLAYLIWVCKQAVRSMPSSSST